MSTLSDIYSLPSPEEIEADINQHREVLPIAGAGVTAKHVLSKAKKHKLLILVLLLTLSAFNFLIAWVPRLLGGIVDLVQNGSDMHDIWMRVGIIAATAIGCGILGTINFALLSILGQHILTDMRDEVVETIIEMPTQRVEKTGMGDALSRVADDVEVASSALQYVVPSIVNTLFSITAITIGLVLLDYRYFLVILVFIPFLVMGMRWYLPKTNRMYQQDRLARGRQAQTIMSSIHGRRTVQAYELENRQVERIAFSSRVLIGLWIRIAVLVAKVNGFIEVGRGMSVAASLIISFLLYQAGGISIGNASAAGLYVLALMWPLEAIMWDLDQIQTAAASLKRMSGVALHREDLLEHDPASPKQPQDASIDVDAVSHAYVHDADGNERVVVKPLNLHIPAGQKIAFVGASGAGKSTLVSIIAGTLKPAHGTVRWGGVALEDIPSVIHRQFGVIISQDVHVFSGTLGEDLRLAKADATDDELWAALAEVGAKDWAMALESGLDTAVGETGLRLTGEQAQQLALARVVLRDPQILVMDEATADEGSAGLRHLEVAAERISRGRTTLIVAHRLSQAAQADRIIVMEQGAVVEDGNHAELVAAGGTYARLWQAWSHK